MSAWKDDDPQHADTWSESWVATRQGYSQQAPRHPQRHNKVRRGSTRDKEGSVVGAPCHDQCCPNLCHWCGREFISSQYKHHVIMCALRTVVTGQRRKLPPAPEPRKPKPRRRRQHQDDEDNEPPPSLMRWYRRWKQWWLQISPEEMRQVMVIKFWMSRETRWALVLWRRWTRIWQGIEQMIRRSLIRSKQGSWLLWRQWWLQVDRQEKALEKAVKWWLGGAMARYWRHWRDKTAQWKHEKEIAEATVEQWQETAPREETRRQRLARERREHLAMREYWFYWWHWFFPFRLRKWREQKSRSRQRPTFRLGAWKDFRRFNSAPFGPYR